MRIRVPISEHRDASYEILIGRGLLAELPRLLAQHCGAARYAIIADSHVAKLYGERVVEALNDNTLPAELLVFPAGEWNKTRETWAALSDRLLAARFGRDCAVIALGGGVVGDLAGFVAATYLRGVPYVQVPTSLLAMIDSSIGGKTGVDAPAGKNLLGAFHQPRLVVADLDVLGSLAPGQLAVMLGHAALAVLGTAMQIVAATLAPAAYVNSVRRTSAVFAVLMGRALFDEPDVAGRLTGAALATAGVACLLLAG